MQKCLQKVALHKMKLVIPYFLFYFCGITKQIFYFCHKILKTINAEKTKRQTIFQAQAATE